MASFRILPLALFLSSLFIHATLGEIVCEELPNEVCAFSISSCSKRCLLETYRSGDDKSVEYKCRTSEIVVEKMSDYIETDDCINACGVDRNTVGISSDSLLESQFRSKLCSPGCYHNCPNLVDLYFNLAAGEGAFLPDLCVASRTNPHRSMIQLTSSGETPGPVPAASLESSIAPASAPM